MGDVSEESDESNGDDLSGSAGESDFELGTDSDDDDAPNQPRIGLRALEEPAQTHEQELAVARLAASNRNWLRVDCSLEEDDTGMRVIIWTDKTGVPRPIIEVFKILNLV